MATSVEEPSGPVLPLPGRVAAVSGPPPGAGAALAGRGLRRGGAPAAAALAAAHGAGGDAPPARRRLLPATVLLLPRRGRLDDALQSRGALGLLPAPGLLGGGCWVGGRSI